MLMMSAAPWSHTSHREKRLFPSHQSAAAGGRACPFPQEIRTVRLTSHFVVFGPRPASAYTHSTPALAEGLVPRTARSRTVLDSPTLF